MGIQEPKNALVKGRELQALAAVSGLALLLRLLVASTPACISGDGVSYVNIAKQIALGGDGFHPIFLPGYSLLIAVVHILFGGSFEQIGRYISAVAGALAIYESVVLVVDNRYFRNGRPEWFKAVACAPPWLREMAQFDGPDGHRVRLLSYR